MAPNIRTSLRRGKKVKYTQLGAIPIPPEPDDNPTQTDLTESQSVSVSVSVSASQSGVLKRKGRGPGQLLAPRLPTARPVIWPVGKEEFTTEKNPTQIISLITKLALQLMPGPCISFLLFDQNTRDALENHFLERFTYRSTENVNHCKEVFEAIATKRYANELREARKKCRKKFGWNTEAWKSMVPHWCKTFKYWYELCDIYGTPEYKALSQRNQANRCASGLSPCHYAGSISAYRHAQNLKILLGRDPTAEELFVHLHVGRENGQSPVVAQAIAELTSKAKEMDAIREENNDGDELPTEEEEIIADVQSYETSSLQFANSKTKEVFEKAKEMLQDRENAGREAIEVFCLAAAKKSHGRDWGFGSNFEDSMPTTVKSISRFSSTTSVLTVEAMEERQEEFKQMIENQNAHFTEEIDKRDKIIEGYEVRFSDMAAAHAAKQAEMQTMISHLFVMIGMQKPTYQGNGSISQPYQGAVSQPFQSVLGMHVPTSRGNVPISEPGQGAFGINVPSFQNNDAFNYGALLGMQVLGTQMQPTSQGLGLQALLVQGSNAEADMGQWCAESNLDN